jgi:polyisoprenoid-binding protein YceI
MRPFLPVPAVPLVACTLLLAGCGQGPATPPAPPPLSAAKGWALDPAASRLSFVSVKGAEIAEVHHFQSLSGGVAADGTATLEIPLDSVETGIPIRNERMREFLFQTGVYPKARVTARIDPARIEGLAVGAQLRMPLSGELNLHGVTAPIETEVSVTRAGDTRVVVASLDPLIVNAATFGLDGGVAELMKLAKLDSIAADVPVSFQLTFTARS